MIEIISIRSSLSLPLPPVLSAFAWLVPCDWRSSCGPQADGDDCRRKIHICTRYPVALIFCCRWGICPCSLPSFILQVFILIPFWFPLLAPLRRFSFISEEESWGYLFWVKREVLFVALGAHLSKGLISKEKFTTNAEHLVVILFIQRFIFFNIHTFYYITTILSPI